MMMLEQSLNWNMCITTLELKVMMTKSKYHIQCSTELGLKWGFASLLESKWEERWRWIPLLKTVYVASCPTWEILTHPQRHASKVDGQQPRTQKTTEGLCLAAMCLKKVLGSFAVTAICLHYSKATQNKRGQKINALFELPQVQN